MHNWSRTSGRFLIILLWLFFISLPVFAFVLAARQQIMLGSSETYVRFVLLQDPNSEGIGVELARPSPVNPSCTQTSVRYFMWVGEPENVDFCQCIEQHTGYALPATPGTCSPP